MLFFVSLVRLVNMLDFRFMIHIVIHPVLLTLFMPIYGLLLLIVLMVTHII